MLVIFEELGHKTCSKITYSNFRNIINGTSKVLFSLRVGQLLRIEVNLLEHIATFIILNLISLDTQRSVTNSVMSFSSAAFLKIQKVAPVHLPEHTSTALTEGSFIII